MLSFSPRSAILSRLISNDIKKRFPGTYLSSNSVIPYENIKIGRGTYGHIDIQHLRKPNYLSIGNYCSIGKDVMLLAGGNHPGHRPSLFPFKSRFIAGHDVDASTKGPIIIGNDV